MITDKHPDFDPAAPTAMAELPRYRCHKEVWALKIKGIAYVGPLGTVITPEDERYRGFEVSAEYMEKHKPQIGGYWVLYKDGYQSYSPAKAFEEGYAEI